MSMFGPKEGSWWIRSKKDPRWNCDGRGYLLFSAGLPAEAEKKVEESFIPPNSRSSGGSPYFFFTDAAQCFLLPVLVGGLEDPGGVEQAGR